MPELNFFWLRRDLRLHDNAGLYHALNGEHPVLPVFIFDRNILDDLEDKKDARVSFIYQEILRLEKELKKEGSALLVKYGYPEKIWKELATDYDIAAVYANRDYEPYAKEMDKAVKKLLDKEGVAFHSFKDQVIFEQKEVVKDDGDPYVVFTPYSRKWKEKLRERTVAGPDGSDISYYLKSYPVSDYVDNLYQTGSFKIPALKDMGFEASDVEIPSRTVSQGLIKKYADTRDYPAKEGTSRLGIHFRFGTISIREKVRKAMGLSEVFLNELIWREFYAMILDQFPHVEKESFRSKYDRIEWRNNDKEFKAWCEGKTGYPLVDAGMRQLNETGYMHNRVRMVTASFLTKHLLIDWRWGEAYFAKKLLDYELSSNNGGWQWAAGCGTDAAPYFRIFNPESQLKKYDKDLEYVRQWVPEYGTDEYVEPMVDHKEARERCLRVYKKAVQ